MAHVVYVNLYYGCVMVVLFNEINSSIGQIIDC